MAVGSREPTIRQRAGRVLFRAAPLAYRILFVHRHPLNRRHPWRAVGRLVRFELVCSVLGRPTRVPLGDRSHLTVYADETNARKSVNHNPPNWPEMAFWQQRLHPGDLFVDVGSNIGIYTVLAQDLGARTISFEPDRRNCARLLENLGSNGYVGEVHNKAVADRPGVLRLTRGLDSFNHLLLEPGATAGAVEVETVALDSVLGDRCVAGLKVDVEGAERLVLAGAERALREQRIALLQCEWSEGMAERTLGESRDAVAALLRGHGYVLHRLDDQGRPRLVEGDVPPGKDVFAAPRRLDGQPDAARR
jgi:FkbM family methyltransferase